MVSLPPSASTPEGPRPQPTTHNFQHCSFAQPGRGWKYTGVQLLINGGLWREDDPYLRIRGAQLHNKLPWGIRNEKEDEVEVSLISRAGYCSHKWIASRSWQNLGTLELLTEGTTYRRDMELTSFCFDNSLFSRSLWGTSCLTVVQMEIKSPAYIGSGRPINEGVM